MPMIDKPKATLVKIFSARRLSSADGWEVDGSGGIDGWGPGVFMPSGADALNNLYFFAVAGAPTKKRSAAPRESPEGNHGLAPAGE